MKIRKFQIFIKENNNSNKLLGYHITRRLNIDSIKENGLLPKVPEDFGEDGDIEGVYLFKTYDDAQTALYQWLGERIDDWEEKTGEEYDEVCLVVDLSGLEEYLINSVEYEWICTVKIDPERILKIKKI